MTVKDFIFILWLQSGKSVATTLAAIEKIAVGQFDTYESGGKILVSASINGQSYSYDIKNFNEFDMVSLARNAWTKLQGVTDAELTAWLTTSSGRSATASFTNLDAR